MCVMCVLFTNYRYIVTHTYKHTHTLRKKLRLLGAIKKKGKEKETQHIHLMYSSQTDSTYKLKKGRFFVFKEKDGNGKLHITKSG